MSIENQHDDFKEHADKWRYAWDHYRGTPILDSIDKASRDEERHASIRVKDGSGNDRTPMRRAKTSPYLSRHDQGESDDAYRERAKITDFTPLFAVAVDTLAGVFYANNEDVEREWGPNMGSPEEGIMSRLWDNIDGDGLNYETLWNQLTTRLIAMHTHWVLVEGLSRDEEGRAEGDASVKLISPLDVTNWREEGGRLVEVVVKEHVDTRTSVLEESAPQMQYVLYTLDGYQRWRPAGEDGLYVADEMRPYFSDGGQYMGVDGRPILPIFRAELTMDRHVGYLAARKANAHFNLESSRDWLLWVANFIRFIFDHRETGMDPQEAMEWLRQGWSTLSWGEHTFINPSSEPAELATKVLEAKKKEFFDTIFQQYNDAAREKTATEIKIDQRDLRAFMVMLTTAVDEAENAAQWRLAQVYYPNNKKAWGEAGVQRSMSFEDLDAEALAERLTKRYFGGRVHVDRMTRLEMAKRIIALDGVPFDEEGLEELYEDGVPPDAATTLITMLSMMELPPSIEARVHEVVLEALGLDLEDEDVNALLENARESEIARSQERAAFGELPEDDLDLDIAA